MWSHAFEFESVRAHTRASDRIPSRPRAVRVERNAGLKPINHAALEPRNHELVSGAKTESDA